VRLIIVNLVDKLSGEILNLSASNNLLNK